MERLISVDSHVKTTHEDVKKHLASKYHDEYDSAVATQTQHEKQLMAGGVRSARMEFKHEAWGRPGHGDPYERLKDMDRDGVEVEVLYCEVSAFRYFYRMKDGWRAAARAFNDALKDFASVNHKRLLVSYQIPLGDTDHAVEEVQRLAAAGARSVHLPNYPNELGLPEYYDSSYDKLWSALQETGIPISQHLAVKETLYDVFRRDPTPQKGIFTSQPAMMLAETMGFWILTGILERFPGLKIVFVEPGLMWVPYYLDKIDRFMSEGAYQFPAIKELPSFYFHRQIALTFMDDARGLRQRYDIGVENIMWSTDYPHPATTWPHSRESIARQFQGVPDNERQLMTCGNAARFYGLN